MSFELSSQTALMYTDAMLKQVNQQSEGLVLVGLPITAFLAKMKLQHRCNIPLRPHIGTLDAFRRACMSFCQGEGARS